MHVEDADVLASLALFVLESPSLVLALASLVARASDAACASAKSPSFSVAPAASSADGELVPPHASARARRLIPAKQTPYDFMDRGIYDPNHRRAKITHA
jgi:hypothetical protein